MDTDTTSFRPPYMSFQTFWNFIEELAAKPLPPAIDRSLMTSKSGTDQNNLTMALTSFGFTDEQGKVQPALIELVAVSPEDRPAKFAASVQRFYAPPLAVSAENGTSADLNTSFTETWPSIASADTRRKSMTFFLHAARHVGIDLSPHFPQSRSGQGAPGTGKKRTASRRRPAAPGSNATTTETNNGSTGAAKTTSGYTKTVELESGGVVTLSWDVNLAESSDTDEAFVLGLVRQLRRYQSGTAADGKSGGGAS